MSSDPRSVKRSRSLPVKSVLALVLTLLLVSLATQASAQRKAGVWTLFAVLNGGQETAGSVSNSFGVGHFTFDPSDRMLCYAINYTALGSAETAAHFHGPARPGEDAGVLIPIPEAGSPKEGCVGPLTNKQRNMLRRGRIYVNVHSTLAPGGEIRGQVALLKTVR